jgi:hypothetical protein
VFPGCDGAACCVEAGIFLKRVLLVILYYSRQHFLFVLAQYLPGLLCCLLALKISVSSLIFGELTVMESVSLVLN